MGRELRKVPEGWRHPVDEKGHYIPLKGGSFSKALADWEEGERQWKNGLRKSWLNDTEKWIQKEEQYAHMSYEEWSGNKPEINNYMPEWKDEELTHIQLYETTTEGTPRTPVFRIDQLDELCVYAEKHVSTFASYMASKEEWKDMLSKGLVYQQHGNMIFL